MSDVDKVKALLVGGTISTIVLVLYGLVACKIGSELGGPAMAGCRAINLMLSLPSGIFIGLAIVLVGIIYNSVSGREGEIGRA